MIRQECRPANAPGQLAQVRRVRVKVLRSRWRRTEPDAEAPATRAKPPEGGSAPPTGTAIHPRRVAGAFRPLRRHSPMLEHRGAMAWRKPLTHTPGSNTSWPPAAPRHAEPCPLHHLIHPRSYTDPDALRRRTLDVHVQHLSPCRRSRPAPCPGPLGRQVAPNPRIRNRRGAATLGTGSRGSRR